MYEEEGEFDLDGRAVAIVRVAAVRPWLPFDASAAMSEYEPGWMAWELVDVRRIECDEPVLAARGIYEVELDAA